MAEPAARQRVNWGVLGVEAAAIFVSVLLGFAVTEWRDARNEARRMEAARAAFAQEIAINRRSVEDVLDYHRAMAAGLSEIAAGPPASSLDSVFARAGWRGLNPVAFRTAAWQAADATGALGLLDYREAQAIALAYTFQSRVEAFQTEAFLSAFDVQFYDDDNVYEATRALGNYFGISQEFEAGLVDVYTGVLAMLGEDGAPVAAPDARP